MDLKKKRGIFAFLTCRQESKLKHGLLPRQAVCSVSYGSFAVLACHARQRRP